MTIAHRSAMILAAGRGARMRPLSDHTPKPLLPVMDKPLIVWQIERLRDAGFKNIVINVAWLAEKLCNALGDGSSFGVEIQWSVEAHALETAGGIATAMSLLAPGPIVAISGDIWTDFDYSRLHTAIDHLDQNRSLMHLVMVENPLFHPQGDFSRAELGLCQSTDSDAGQTLTFGNIGVYHRDLFAEVVPGQHAPLAPLMRRAIADRRASAELHPGAWHNIGTPEQLQTLNQHLSDRGH